MDTSGPSSRQSDSISWQASTATSRPRSAPNSRALDTKEKLLTAAAEIEAAVRPKNAAAALMAVDNVPSAKIREKQREIDAIRARFGNLNIQQGGCYESSDPKSVTQPS